MTAIKPYFAFIPAAIILSSSVCLAADQDNSQSKQPAGSPSAQQGAHGSDPMAEPPVAGMPQARNDSADARDRTAGALNRKDRKFIDKAAADSVAEIELGQLAQSKAANEDVKEFGAHMVQQHGQASDELKQIAQSKGVSVAEVPDRKHQRKMKDLDKYSGAEFDRRYMAEMVKEHEKDLKLFRETAQNAKDPEVRAFAEKTAQTISEHLEMARKIAGDVGASASRTTKKPAGEM